MGKVKQLAEYLKKCCPLWDDLNYKEKKETEACFNAEGLSMYLDFNRVEEVDGITNWVYPCELCGEEHFIPMHTGDFDYLGQTPTEEEDSCMKYTSNQTCHALLLQLRNTHGKEPEGARLAVKSEPGGGGYYEVVCYWDPKYPMSYAYSLMLEGNMPKNWSPAAKAYLKERTGV